MLKMTQKTAITLPPRHNGNQKISKKIADLPIKHLTKKRQSPCHRGTMATKSLAKKSPNCPSKLFDGQFGGRKSIFGVPILVVLICLSFK